MAADEVFVNYHGFHPSDISKKYIDMLLDEIHHEAPCGATLRAVFTKKDLIFKGTLNVHSSAGPFFAAATEESLKKVADHMLEQMRRRFEKWKSKRSQHSSIKDIPYLDSGTE
ncbi:MAG: hypothetical protein ACOYOK_08100 [Pseudobdellovibrionaceae bacterium]